MRLGVWTDHHDPQSTGPSVRLPQADVRPLKLPGACWDNGRRHVKEEDWSRKSYQMRLSVFA